MAMFPVLQWVYRNDVAKREIIPQLAYGLEGTAAPMPYANMFHVII